MSDKVKFGIVCLGSGGGGILCVIPVVLHFPLQMAIALWEIGTIMYFAGFFISIYFMLQKPEKK